MSVQEDFERAIRVIEQYQPLDTPTFTPVGGGLNVTAHAQQPIAMHLPGGFAVDLMYSPQEESGRHWYMKWSPTIGAYPTLGAAMAAWFKKAGFKPFDMFFDEPMTPSDLGYDDPGFRELWDTLIAWGFQPPPGKPHPWGEALPVPPPAPRPVKGPSIGSGKIKVVITPVVGGSATLEPVNGDWIDAFRQQVVDNGGPDETSAFIPDGGVLEPEISKKALKDLKDGNTVTVLMDPWIVGNFYGYEAKEVAEMGLKEWQRREARRSGAPNPPEDGDDGLIYEEEYETANPRKPKAAKSDAEQVALQAAAFMRRLLSFWQPMQEPSVGFWPSPNHWYVTAYPLGGILVGVEDGKPVIDLAVYDNPRKFTLTVWSVSGKNTFTTPNLDDAIRYWFEDYVVDPRSIFDLKAETPDEQTEFDWAIDALTKRLDLDPSKALPEEESLEDLTTIEVDDIISDRYERTEKIEEQLDEAYKAMTGEKTVRDYVGFPKGITVNIPSVESVVESFEANFTRRDGSCIDDSMMETMGELLFLEDYQKFGPKKFWSDYDIDMPKGTKPGSSNLHEMWQLRDDSWSKFEEHNLDWDDGSRPEEPDREDFESDKAFKAAEGEFEKARETWETERSDALSEEWAKGSGCVHVNLMDGYKRAAGHHGIGEKTYPKTAKANPGRGRKTWTGPAYRGGGSGDMPRGLSAYDVVRYEIDELGNADLKVMLPDAKLKKIPARGLVWVTKTAEQAERYGDVEEVELGENAEIIAFYPDEEGGYLVRPEYKNPPDAAGRFDYIQGRYKMSETAANPRKKKASGVPFKKQVSVEQQARDAAAFAYRLLSFWQPMQEPSIGLTPSDTWRVTMLPLGGFMIPGAIAADETVFDLLVIPGDQTDGMRYEISGSRDKRNGWSHETPDLNQAFKYWFDENEIDYKAIAKIKPETQDEADELAWGIEALKSIGLDTEPEKPAYTFDDGYKIWELKTREALKTVNDQTGEHFDFEDVKSSKARFFALVDPHVETKAVIELAGDKDLLKEVHGDKIDLKAEKERIGEWLQSISAYQEDPSEGISYLMWERYEPNEILYAVSDYYMYEDGNQDSAYEGGEYDLPTVTPIDYEDADDVLSTAMDIWEQKLRDTHPHARRLEVSLEQIEEIAQGIVSHSKHVPKGGKAEDPKYLTNRAWKGLIEGPIPEQFVAKTGLELREPAAFKAYLEYVFENAEKGTQVQALCALVLIELGELDTAHGPPLKDAPGQEELAFNRKGRRA